MKLIIKWIRIVCVCVLALGLFGCSCNCVKQSGEPTEIGPASAEPQNQKNDPDTITEDEVISSNTGNKTNDQPTLPPENEASDETAAPGATETTGDIEAPEIELPEDTAEATTPGSQTSAATSKPTATPSAKTTPAPTAVTTAAPTPTPTPDTSSSPSPSTGDIELPEVPLE